MIRTASGELDSATAAALVAANDPAGGVLVVRVLPDTRRAGVIGRLILEALGKDLALKGAVRNEHEQIRLAQSWLRAHRIRRLLLIEPQFLQVRVADRALARFATTVPEIDLLCLSGVRGDHVRAFRRAGAAECHVATMVADYLTPTFTPVSPAGTAEYPAVPDVDFPDFGRRCRQELSPEGLAVVEATVRSARTSARAWLDTAGPEVEVPSMRRLLYGLLDKSSCRAECEAVVRGVQLEMFRQGWHLRVSLPNLLRQRHADGRDPEALAPRFSELLAYVLPSRAACCVLADFGLDEAAILAVKAADVAPGGDGVNLSGCDLAVTDPAAQVILRAALADHDAQALVPADALLTGMSPTTMVDSARAALLELGVAVRSPMLRRNKPHAGTWWQTTGLCLTRMGTR